jgi:class 3 adenylate cyclase/tetratricopeptide (TPR) repeat protein
LNVPPPDALADLLKGLDTRPHLHSLCTETLRLLLSWCERYNVQTTAPALPPQAVEILRAITAAHGDLAPLLSLWRDRDPEVWRTSVTVYRTIAEALLKQGSPLLALEIVNEGLDRERFAGDVRLRQLQGLALANSRTTERAIAVLAELRQQGHADEETLGLLGRAYKDRGAIAVDRTERHNLLHQSFEIYYECYNSNPDSYWTGINVATLATLTNQSRLAHQVARPLEHRCRLAVESPLAVDEPEKFWLTATVAEALLNLGRFDEAEEWYRKAGRLGQKSFGYLLSARRNGRLLLAHLARDLAWLDRALGIPCVVMFAGHMMDYQGRPVPRFPPQLETAAARTIRQRLERMNGRIGFASAARGSDLLFQEALAALNGEAHVVLPYNREEFLADSVKGEPDARWEQRFRGALERAVRLVIASPNRLASREAVYNYTNAVLQGLAGTRAAELEVELKALVFWNGARGDSPGGTATRCQEWRKLGIPLELIDADQLLRDECPNLYVTPERRPAAGPSLATANRESGAREPEVKTMLFADAVHYSKLTEEQVPRFVQHFLGKIAELLAEWEERVRARKQPQAGSSELAPATEIVRNTWGDGLYLVFDGVRDAGLFALELCERTNIDWSAEPYRLPGTLKLRIALHAGPVFACYDPVTGQRSYTGTHVSRAARIEPITPPGEVYASDAFAALAHFQGVTEFVCDYVKHAELPKKYGTFPTFLVRRRPTSADTLQRGEGVRTSTSL